MGTHHASEGHARCSVSAVIPALNEEESLPYVLAAIPEWVDEIVVVDGHSTDDTVAVAKRFGERVRVVPQEGKGKGGALRTGFWAATGDIIVALDADGSTDPSEIGAFVRRLRDGADYVKGSRFLQGADTIDMTPVRHVGNWGLVTLTNVLFGTRFTDITYGYNATWSRHRDMLALEIDDWSQEIINNIRAARNGLNVVEVVCFEHERIAGTAKLQTFSAGWQILRAILRERMVPRKRVVPPRKRPPLTGVGGDVGTGA
jgi:glycosyltransferase involved in cell wall biosynthesis